MDRIEEILDFRFRLRAKAMLNLSSIANLKSKIANPFIHPAHPVHPVKSSSNFTEAVI
jgi:hypothetical protein